MRRRSIERTAPDRACLAGPSPRAARRHRRLSSEEATMADTDATLRGVSDIRGFFRTNRTPIFFVSPTAFNLLGIDRWVRGFHYVNYFDSFEGSHPRVFV